MTSRSNAEWIRLVASQDPDVMVELWSMVVQWGLTSAYKRQQSEDLGRDAAVQAFIRITKNLGGFSEKGTFVGWCRVIVVREVLRLLEKRQKEVPTLGTPLEEIKDIGSADPPPQLPPKSIRARLQPCIDNLKTREKQVVEGFYYQELSPYALADVMGVTVNNVHQLLHRARKKLQACLNGLGFSDVGDVFSP